MEGGGAQGADSEVTEDIWDFSSPGLGFFPYRRTTSSEVGVSFSPSLSKRMNLYDNMAEPKGTEEPEGTPGLLPILQTSMQEC